MSPVKESAELSELKGRYHTEKSISNIKATPQAYERII